MAKNNNSGFGFLLGALAGAAAGYWLNTTKGKLWRKQAMASAEELSSSIDLEKYKETAKQKVDEYSNLAKQKADEYAGLVQKEAEYLKSKVDEVSQKGKEFVEKKMNHSSSDDTETTPQEAVQQGLENAQENINNISN